MRLSTIVNVLTGAAVMAANPLAQKLQRDQAVENGTVKVIIEKVTYECPKVKPKVFIISMVRILTPKPLTQADPSAVPIRS